MTAGNCLSITSHLTNMRLDAFNVFCDWWRRGSETEGAIYQERSTLRIMWPNKIWPPANAIALSPSAITSVEELESAFALAVEYMRGQPQVGIIWVFEESFTAAIWAAMLNAADTTGLQLRATPISMSTPEPASTDSYVCTEPIIPKLTYRLVKTSQDMERYSGLYAKVNRIPIEVCRASLVSPFMMEQNYCFLALWDGEPVSIAAVGPAAGWLFVVCVATLEEHRGRGYGTAVTQVAIRKAAKETGIRKIMVQSSSRAVPVYQRMGFHSTGGIRGFALKA
jgi:GNAT superfamily N-acetyltransferase